MVQAGTVSLVHTRAIAAIPAMDICDMSQRCGITGLDGFNIKS